ncbi:prolyl 4-hydroxylase subunit alpha [Pedobacter sp. HMF7647]|uniref:Prolyl 4-hydroxylase subunit alpha n=1 Tax=Hufsiella arboris TaxID=2695275 RepID=A0A7K1YEN2_9SPHI|nr:2OG-Fe(II) oxygenase [Hufsiella arboris]MXV52860.1 prolyl 4-hydroxylase subunit alpha [Hufsiella arboris]
MDNIIERLETVDWQLVCSQLNDKGYSQIKGLVTPHDCDVLRNQYGDQQLFRKTITMERYRFGKGEYRYYNYPLPELIHLIRENVYEKLAPAANSWMNVLHIDRQYPASLSDLQSLCRAHNQHEPTVLILNYKQGGFNTLHQDLYGDIFFPFQLVLFLNEPGTDYEGGEFVLTEQVPRAQSKAIVLRPGKGDALIFTTNFRPVKGNHGFYRANMKHGVSEVLNGNRYSLGIIFHDAVT